MLNNNSKEPYAGTNCPDFYLDMEGRHDLVVPKGSAEVELVAIDPGKLVPVQAATVPLSICLETGKLATYLATNERALFSVNVLACRSLCIDVAV